MANCIIAHSGPPQSLSEHMCGMYTGRLITETPYTVNLGQDARNYNYVCLILGKQTVLIQPG